jgi:hypothetical protein
MLGEEERDAEAGRESGRGDTIRQSAMGMDSGDPTHLRLDAGRGEVERRSPLLDNQWPRRLGFDARDGQPGDRHRDLRVEAGGLEEVARTAASPGPERGRHRLSLATAEMATSPHGQGFQGHDGRHHAT